MTEANEESKERMESEVVLNITPDLGLDKFELRDFKLCKKSCQFRLLFRLKTDYKVLDKDNFKLFIFSSVTGDMEGFLDFNPGKEEIKNDTVYHDAWVVM